MPRSLRVVRAGQPLHIIQRGNNRGTSFNDAHDALRYKGVLGQAAEQAGCAIHAYVFMSNHVHLLVTPQGDGSASRMMQMVGRRYVRYFNDRHARTGTLWEGRFRSMLIDSSNYFFACSRYIELNPVRAGIVIYPGAYRWSSFRYSTSGEADGLLTPHELFEALGSTGAERRTAYRAMFGSPLDEATIGAIRRATNTGSIMSVQHQRELKRRATGLARTRGRPRAVNRFQKNSALVAATS